VVVTIDLQKLKGLASMIMDNIHSVLFMLGLTLINTAVYLWLPLLGLAISGVFLIVISYLLDPERGDN